VSKTKLQHQCRSILNKYNVNEKVSDENEESFLLDLFQQHPEWSLKQGVGVDSICIGNSDFRTRCFVLLRVDGTRTDISFQKCLSKPSKEQELRQACRMAIRPRIHVFRHAHVVYGVTRCPITGDTLTESNTHIDHYDLTFDAMFRLWMQSQDIEQAYKKLSASADNEYGRRFADPQFAEDFARFHDIHCRLRAVTKEANLSILRSRVHLP
jgi:hypothetical protein